MHWASVKRLGQAFKGSLEWGSLRHGLLLLMLAGCGC